MNLGPSYKLQPIVVVVQLLQPVVEGVRKDRLLDLLANGLRKVGPQDGQCGVASEHIMCKVFEVSLEGRIL